MLLYLPILQKKESAYKNEKLLPKISTTIMLFCVYLFLSLSLSLSVNSIKSVKLELLFSYVML